MRHSASGGRLGLAMILALASASSSRGELLPLPNPTLAGVEDAVRVQLLARRASLAELIESSASGGAAEDSLAGAYGALGQVYFAYEIMDAAEPCLLNARALDPGELSWPYLLGALYSRSGDVDRALENFLASAALQPDDVPTQLRLGRLYLDLSRLEEAEASFSRALEEKADTAAGLHGLALIAQERGDWSMSLEALQSALELQPSASSIHYLIGIAFRELGELESARQHFGLNRHSPVIFQDPEVDGLESLIEGGRYYLKLGELARGRGNEALAIKSFREAVSRGPGDPLSHYNLGLSLIHVGRRSEGERHLREAIRLDPEYRDAHFNLGVVLAQADQMLEAEGHFEKALEIDPGDESARLAWTRSLIWIGRGDEAVAELETMLERDSGNPDQLLALAEAQEANGRTEEARANLLEVIANPREAAYAARAHERLSAMANAKGARPEAIEHLRLALRMDPRLPGAFEKLGTLLGQEGSFRDAAVEFAKAVEAEPLSLSARFGQVMSLLLSGQAAKAKQRLEEGLDFLPESVPLRHLLARVLATASKASLRDGMRALALAREVYRVRESPDHAETVAMAMAENGRFAEAIEWQDRALALAARASGRDLVSLQRRRELYARREPCRSPWLGP